MTSVNQPERLVETLYAILTDEQSSNSFLAKLQSIEKIVADFILVAVLYEIATRTGVYKTGALRNITLVAIVFIGYILSPIDAIPDAVPIVGQVDDWVAAATVLALYIDLVIKFSKDVVNQGVPNNLTEEMPPKIREIIEEACRAVANTDSKTLMSEIEKVYSCLPKTVIFPGREMSGILFSPKDNNCTPELLAPVNSR